MLAIGIKERAFFSPWNSRFSRFVSLKERIDRELKRAEAAKKKVPQACETQIDILTKGTVCRIGNAMTS